MTAATPTLWFSTKGKSDDALATAAATDTATVST